MDESLLHTTEEPVASLPDAADTNILREKTFTPELRDLVKRATDNEPGSRAGGAPVEEEDLDSISGEDLIRRFYKLFYLAKNLEDNLEINSSFNPMELHDDVDTDLSFAISEYIGRQLDRYGLSSYAILSFSIGDAAFVPAYSNLATGGENIAIGLSDRIYQEALASEDGIVITADDIHNNICIEKQLSIHDVEPASVYVAPLSIFTSVLVAEMPFLDNSNPVLPSSLILISLPEKRTLMDAEAIARMIRRQLVVPLFMFEISLSGIVAIPDDNGPAEQARDMSRIIQLALSQNNRVGAVISYSKNDSPEHYYLFRYSLARILSALTTINLVIHPVSTRAFVSFNSEEMDAFNKMLEDEDPCPEIGISAKLYLGQDRLKFYEIVQDIFAPL